MKIIPDELIEAFKKRQVIQTQWGIFYTEAISIPGKIMPFFLPSDSFSKDVIYKNFIPQIEIWSENFSKGTAPLPVPTITIEIERNNYIFVENELKDEGTAYLEDYGTFDLQEFPFGDLTNNKWTISFCPSHKLREILNPS